MSSAERTQLRDKLLPVGPNYRVPGKGIVALLSLEKLQIALILGLPRIAMSAGWKNDRYTY